MAISGVTNSASLIALYNFNQSTASLNKSVERLSSGLRINRAADDAAGMTIADSLASQSQSMGQAIRNATDGISIMQIADSALSESINLISSVRTKAVQAAQDSQTSASRQVLQNDIDKLLEEFDLIARTSKFNEHPLLTGVFSGKEFQVGASSGETISAFLSSAESTKVGHVNTAKLSITNETGGSVHLRFTNNSGGESLTLQSVGVEYANDIEKSMQAVADQINNYQEETDISARAVVESTGADAVQAGATSATFAVNGVDIGTVTTSVNDSDGTLINAINNKTSSTGVTASITSSGQLQLTSDGRPIEVTGAGTALTASDANSASTFGHIQLYQRGAYSIDMDDLSSGLAVSFTSNLDFSGTMTTSIDSTLASSSVLGAASTLTAGFTTGAVFTDSSLNGNVVTTRDSTLETGSALAAASIIAKDSVFGGSGVSDNQVTSTGDSLLAAGSTLISGSTLVAGTYLTNDISTASGTVSAGTTLSAATTTNADTNITNAMLAQSGSVLGTGSIFAKDSTVGGSVTLASTMTMSQNMTLESGSTIVDAAGLSLAVGSTIGGAATIGGSDVIMTAAMTVKTGSVLSVTSSLATGSTIGGLTTLDGDHTTNADLSLSADTVLAAGSVLEQGTELTNDVVTTLGTISAGTTLEQDYTTSGSNTLTYAQTVKSGSILASTSVLTANDGGAASTELTEESVSRLTNLSVLTQEDAQVAMEIADAALADLSAIRSVVGSTQNQFTSSISYLTTSKINIESATSAIMDVDLAEESMVFAKMQILNQSGAFALSQANSLAGNVLSLFQGGQ